MSFIWPVMLLSLGLIPLFLWGYLRIQRQRRQAAANFGLLGMSAAAAGSGSRRRHIPSALFLTGLAILLLAMARPQTEISLPRIEGTVILAFDVSGSMAAEDLQPTRIEAAKVAARSFVQQQPATVQIGIVAFSNGGFTVQMPTNDQEAIFATLNRLTPQRGTSVGQGIIASLNVLAPDDEPILAPDPSLTPEASPTAIPPTPLPEGTYLPAAIVLLTDGENNDAPDPLAAAQLAADRGVRVHTVGIGSTAGTTLHVNGFTVHTRLDEATLQQIAQLTDATYYNAQNEQDLQAIYENLNPQLVLKAEKMEVTSIFAGAGIFVLLIGAVCSLVWFNRLP